MKRQYKFQYCNHCEQPMEFDLDNNEYVCIGCGQVKERRHNHKWEYICKFQPKTGDYFTYNCIAAHQREVYALYYCPCGQGKAIRLEEGQPDFFIECQTIRAPIKDLILGQIEEQNLILKIN